jgi:hypothetical protein
MITINTISNKVYVINDSEYTNNKEKYVHIWKKKYNVTFPKNSDNTIDKIVDFVKS